MRTTTAVSIAALAAAALAACGLNGITSTRPPGGGHTTQPGTVSIGDTLTLTDPGFLNGNEDIAVTVVKVVLSPSSSEFGFGPGPGDQWVAVQVHLKNLAPVPYIDSPNDSLTAIDAARQTIPADYDAPTTVGPQFSDQLHLTSGGTADGVITFDVPNGDKITTLVFTPGDGDGAHIGKWTVD
jgi:Domain of unknown function (DUF4352)